MALSDVGLGFDFTGILNSILSVGGTILLVGLAAAVLGVIGYFVLRPLGYKIKVVLWAVRANGIVQGEDKAKIISGNSFFRKDGVDKLSFFKRKIKLPVPDPKFFIRGEKSDTIYYYKYGAKDYTPIAPTFSNPEVSFVPSEEDTKMWHLYEVKDLIRRNTMKTFMSQYGQYIALGAVVILIIVVAWMVTGVMKELISTAASVGQNMEDAAASLAAAKGG